MCGIAGIVTEDRLAPDDRAALPGMLDDLAPRGPDGRGCWQGPGALLGHTRLAIIDPRNGRQPIANEDRTIHLVVNGEVYNYRSLRSELESRGHRFRTHSDAETVLHLYEEMGPACTERLRGMFALAVWDERRRTLLLARDPIGIKPLYYAQSAGRFIFASRLTAILTHPRVGRTVDLESLHHYLTYHYIPSPGTILRGVRKLQPGQRLILRQGQLRAETYWDASFQADEQTTDDEWICLVRDGIDEAVRAHLVSDVPLGAFLSGGLDSGAVATAMARITDAPIRTHTVGFDDERFDERAEARALADRIGADHLEQLLRPGAASAASVAETMAGCFDEPFADPSAIPTYFLSRTARRRVKAVLSGDGGDELFAGYTRYRRAEALRSLRRLAYNPYARWSLRACARPFGRRVRAAARNLTADRWYAHYQDVAWFDPTETRRLLGPDTRRALQGHDPFDLLADLFARCDSPDPLAQCQYADLKTWLPDGVLCKVDRASMANGLEVRVPLLDVPFVERMAGLPSRLKIVPRLYPPYALHRLHRLYRRFNPFGWSGCPGAPGWPGCPGGPGWPGDSGRPRYAAPGKFILRRAMEPVLGRRCVDRRKRGFEVPLDDWFAGPLQPLVHDLLLDHDACISRWLDPAAVHDVWRQFCSGRRGIGPRLWALLMLEMWCRRHLAAPVRASSDPTLGVAGDRRGPTRTSRPLAASSS